LNDGIQADAHPGAQSSVVPIDDDDAVWGSGFAPVTIVAFLDFQCPFCRASHPTLNALLQEYGPAKLRFVFKHYPLPSHEGGVAAALAAQAVNDVAGAKAFFAYQSELYSDEGGLSPDFSESALIAQAVAVGVNRQKFEAALRDPNTSARVENDIALADRIGISAVPAFLINGLPVVGAAPKQYFERLIDDELDATARAANGGITPQQMYEHRMKANLTLIAGQGS
jgi:protein-disulfide isomerase